MEVKEVMEVVMEVGNVTEVMEVGEKTMEMVEEAMMVGVELMKVKEVMNAVMEVGEVAREAVEEATMVGVILEVR